jgi:hypothetical protein
MHEGTLSNLYTTDQNCFIIKMLHLNNIDEYSNTNRIVVPNIRILIFGIRFSSTRILNMYIFILLYIPDIQFIQ